MVNKVILMKKFITLATVILVLFSSVVSAFALKPDSRMYDNYTYSNDGTPLSSPASYIATKFIDNASFNLPQFPELHDVFVSPKMGIFVTDRANNCIIILDEELNIIKILDTFFEENTEYKLQNPEGVFVTESNEIYIADTGNSRILSVDFDGSIKKVINDPNIVVLQEKVTFYPSKIVVDQSERIYVVSKNINRGIVELDSDGNFNGFLGAPRVTPNLVEYLWKRISTREQLARMETYVPTEYNNVAIDRSGFIYATISTLDPIAFTNSILAKDKSGNITPIKRLNFTGIDVLSRHGEYAPVGDIIKDISELPSAIVDVALNENGGYSLLDARRSRIFTYDMDGNLLYIFGGKGNQFGKIQDPSSLDYSGSNIVVTDRSQGRVTMFKITQYGQLIDDAVMLNYIGKYGKSAQKWEEALALNSNLYVAYTGIGKNYFREGKYLEAMNYLKIANEKEYYSRAFKLHRKEVLSGMFNIIGIFTITLIIGIFTLIYRSKRKLKKE